MDAIPIENGDFRDHLLTKAELAHFLGRSTRWIETQYEVGIPHYQVGGGKRFDRGEVLDWLRAGSGNRDD